VISFLVPTLGRPSLLATLRSIETRPGDEILVVGDGVRVSDTRVRYVDCKPGGDFGHTERNVATPHARCRYIAHIDDDDVYAPGHRDLMADAITKTPGRPVLFRMRYPNGITLWSDPKIYCGNVGTPMFLIPNMPTKMGSWKSFVGGDCAFLEESKWTPDEYVWRPEIVALLGHNT
jgi:hypothetical protein